MSSKWLAVFLVLGALYLCPFMFGYGGWYSKRSYREFLFFVPFQQLFLIGPVFFFYVKALLHQNLQLKFKDYLHFLPAAVYLLYSLIVFITDKLVLDEFYFYADGQDKDLDFWYQMAGLISMLFYLLLSLKHYTNYRKLAVQEVSFADEIAFSWIKHFAIAFSLILVLRVLFFILNPEWGEFGSKYWYYLCFSILLLYISISGYTTTIKTTLAFDSRILEGFETPQNGQPTSTENESPNGFVTDEWKRKIVYLFDEEAIYQNANLTLTDLAQRLDSNRNTISKTINLAYKMNFNDFVNQKRTEAVIEKLKKGAHQNSTLLGISLDCGFNSKSTFNRAFKKYTGTTPKQFIEKNAL
jgi:AraC-like DNA-binding protein